MYLPEFGQVPRHAVCCVVLNLPKQDGAARRKSALAEAYRIKSSRYSPFCWVLAQNRCCNITHTAGYPSYTMIKLKWVDKY